MFVLRGPDGQPLRPPTIAEVEAVTVAGTITAEGVTAWLDWPAAGEPGAILPAPERLDLQSPRVRG